MTSIDSRRLSRGRGHSLLGNIKLPSSLTNHLLEFVWLALLRLHIVLYNANCVPMERAMRTRCFDFRRTLLEAQGLWYTPWLRATFAAAVP